jgi:hypothetical protein
MQDFPARLRKHADEHQDDVVRAITLTAFANTISDLFDQHAETTRVEPQPAQPPLALIPAPAREEASARAQPPVAITPAPAKQEAISPVLSSTEHALLKRGDVMLSLGDVSAARMLFARAAELGIAIAALKVADTYDRTFLAEHHLRGIKDDPVEAERWYRKAQSMGEPDAEERLKTLERRAVLATH